MRRIVISSLLLAVCAPPAWAQTKPPSSWGVIASFVPKWEVTPVVEFLALLTFSEDDVAVGAAELRGDEFRIGISRGRSLSGDWGVSFVRKTLVSQTVQGSVGYGCGGGASSGSVVILECEDVWTDLDRRNVRLNGLEVHKFFAFATIARRVQIGLNLAGGIANASGQVDSVSFSETYRCTFPPGVQPQFPPGDPADSPHPCAPATITNRVRVQTDARSDDVTRLLAGGRKTIPLGKVEIGAGVLVGPRVKVRIAGGLNYPGINVVSVTGIYQFSSR